MNEKRLSLKWLPLAWAAPLLTTLTLRAIFPALSINSRSIALTLGISDMFIFSLLVYKIWTLAVVVALYCLLRRKGVTLADIGLKGNLSLKVVGYAFLGAVVAFFMYPLIQAFVKVLGGSMYWAGPEKAVPVGLATTLDLLLVFSLSVVLAPLLEEILFRGYILTVFLQKGCKTFIALLLSAFVFASIHYAFGPGLMLYILFWTFIPCLLYLKFKSLYPAMLMHSLNNLLAYIILPLLWR